MDLPKKSRKWRFRKVKKIGPHSSKYQKDYQNNTHGPAKTHGYTAYQHTTTQHSTYSHSTYTYVHTMYTQHSSMQEPHSLAMDARTWPSVTPGGHSVSVQNRTNLPNRAVNGGSRVPDRATATDFEP